MKTMGMVAVAALAASAGDVLVAAITATFRRARSAANWLPFRRSGPISPPAGAFDQSAEQGLLAGAKSTGCDARLHL
jgi:hypothetical protein